MQKRSVFPSLLGVDAQQATGKCSTQQEHDKSVQRTTDDKLDDRPCTTKQDDPKPRNKTARKTPRNQREEELRQRRHTRAEELVKKWDLLLVKEKEDRHKQLLQRLALQHKLIAKNDILFRQAEREAEDKRAKELQSRRECQKQMIRNLREHNKRIHEHKKMVAEKLESVPSRRFSHSNANNPSSPSPELKHISDTVEETDNNIIAEQDHDDESSDDYSFQPGRTSRLQKMLNFDPIREATPTIEIAWTMLKHDHARQLQPIMEYSLHTRTTANPTSRCLLSYYDNPVRLNSKTGERVPLLEVMERDARDQQANLGRQSSLLTNALELKTRQHQARAEALLHCKQAQVDIPIREPTMYLPKDEYEFLERNRNVSYQAQQARTVPVKHLSTDSHMKRRLPKYLEGNGHTVTESLGEIRKRVYCEPTKGNQPIRQPTFLTDQEADEKTDQRLVTATKFRSRWQPLSSSAAEEYDGTHTVPLKACSGNRGHGKYSMWKPMSSHTITLS